MTIAICADIHHGMSWRGHFREDILTTFHEAIDVAIDHHVGQFIVAGDLYHSSHPHPSAHADIISALYRLEEAHIPTYILVGNHDLQRRANALQPLKEVGWKLISVIEDNFYFTIPGHLPIDCGYTVYLIPYRDVQTDISMSELRTPFISICHAPVIGGMYNSVEVPPTSACLPKTFLDTAVRSYIGHIHSPQKIGNVIIPGSITQTDISDCGQDRFLYLQHDIHKEPEKVKLTRGWKFVKYDLDFVTQKETAKQLYKALTSGNKLDDCDVCQIIMRLTMSDLSNVDLALLHKALKYRILDIPAPIIVRTSDVKLKSVQIDTPRAQAVHDFIYSSLPKDKAPNIFKYAERIMMQVDRETSLP